VNKFIFLDIAGKRHSLYNSIVDYPPDGYNFMSSKNRQGELTQKFCKIDWFYGLQRHLVSKFIPSNFYKSIIDRNKRI